MRLLALLLLGGVATAAGADTSAADLARPLSLEKCWQTLPPAVEGSGQRLPNWALMTARDLPRTTAAMLDLDRLHRTESPLGPILRGQMRWLAADANHCGYARATAEADLRRAGFTDEQMTILRGGHEGWPAADRAALNFAHQMTVNAADVSDAEVASLLKTYGEEKLTAMVLLLAAANFQDRLLLALGVPLEAGGPLAPVMVKFSREGTPPVVPARAKPEDLKGQAVPTHVDDPEWIQLGFDGLQRNLNLQRANEGRIKVPSYEQVLERLPATAPKPKAPIRIKWSLVCMGYQPRLASAWSACTTAFREESKQDRVFEESLFWVVTRTIHCFY